jgi:murein DD-endopeptidase MepM/ murein hydrolase activator NlpD
VIRRISSLLENPASSSGEAQAQRHGYLRAPGDAGYGRNRRGRFFRRHESEYGRLIVIDHGHSFSTVYGHLAKIRAEREKVVKGQVIGTVACPETNQPAPPLRVRVNNNPVNPARFMN